MACSPLYLICHVHHSAQKTQLKLEKSWNAQTKDEYETKQQLLTFFQFELHYIWSALFHRKLAQCSEAVMNQSNAMDLQ